MTAAAIRRWAFIAAGFVLIGWLLAAAAGPGT